MKPIIYNNSFGYNGKFILYNSFSDNFLILERELFVLFKEIVIGNKSDELKKIHSEFYSDLKAKGFLVYKDIKESELCLKKLNEIDNREDIYHLIVNPTINCNFSCWYCYETHIKHSRIDNNTKNNILKYVENIVQDNNIKYFLLSWFGGEPLLQFKNVVRPMLEEIFNICENKRIKFSCNITTNGLLIDDEVINIGKEYNINNFQITLDGHRDRHNEVRYVSKDKGSYDKIVSNIKLLLKNGINVMVRINCSKETFTGLENIMEDFSDVDDKMKQYLIFSFYKVWQVEEKLEDEIHEFIKMFKKKGYKVSSSVGNMEWSCYADKKNHATINYNGDVFKCTARDFSEKNREGVLTDEGTIIWNGKYNKRFENKHKNKSCLECSILPMCKGGCSQHTMDRENKDYCLLDYDENKKKSTVLEYFLSKVQKI